MRANNALVIRAFSRDYKNIIETIKKLDIYPRQVLIEVLLAEISLDEYKQVRSRMGKICFKQSD